MPLKIYKLTKTLSDYEKNFVFTDKKEEADILLVGGKLFDLAEFPKLKGIFKVGIGTDNIPSNECKELDIKIGLPSKKTKDFIYEETANFTCYLILKMLYKNVGALDGWIKKHRTILDAHKLLVLGRGNIGSKVIDKMGNFMQVSSYDSATDNISSLWNQLKDCNVLSLHIPLTYKNKNFMDVKKLGVLKDGALIINTARGKLVDEDALYKEIKSGRLRAAFDVFWEEPYRGKLKDFYPDRFFMTPHVASTSKEFTKGLSNDFRNFLEGINSD